MEGLPPHWRTASDAELAAATLPQQLVDASTPAKPGCEFPFKHGCLGACRSNGALGTSMDMARRISTADDSSDPLSGLRRLLEGSHVAAPRCGLTIIGDSVSHDTFSAALVGALRLGFRLELCSNSPHVAFGKSRPEAAQRYMKHENASWCAERNPREGDPSSLALLMRGGKDQGKEGSQHATSRARGCQHVVLRHILPGELYSAGGGLLRHVLTCSFAIIINEGLHANAPTEYTAILAKRVKPLLVAASSLARHERALLFWRETTPQHFPGSSGTGLFAERSHQKAARATCAPISGLDALTAGVPSEKQRQAVDKSNWRNRHFASWRRSLARSASNGSAPGDLSKLIDGVLPVHALLMPRHDAKLAPDCTHFCFSPFLWTPMWRTLARLLETHSGAEASPPTRMERHGHHTHRVKSQSAK